MPSPLNLSAKPKLKSFAQMRSSAKMVRIAPIVSFNDFAKKEMKKEILKPDSNEAMLSRINTDDKNAQMTNELGPSNRKLAPLKTVHFALGKNWFIPGNLLNSFPRVGETDDISPPLANANKFSFKEDQENDNSNKKPTLMEEPKLPEVHHKLKFEQNNLLKEKPEPFKQQIRKAEPRFKLQAPIQSRFQSLESHRANKKSRTFLDVDIGPQGDSY